MEACGSVVEGKVLLENQEGRDQMGIDGVDYGRGGDSGEMAARVGGAWEENEAGQD